MLLYRYIIKRNGKAMDKLTKEQRHKNMQNVKSKNSLIEIALGKALWAQGFRYRKNDKTVFGKPDFVFKKQKIAIFCDSEFWHGKNWDVRKNDHKTNREFWINKIESNIERDEIVNSFLENEGWRVLRFWGKEIKNNIGFCVENIKDEFKKERIR